MRKTIVIRHCPAAVRALMRVFASIGETAYPVGGCVRDALRGMPPHDWDVAVTTPPDQTRSICEAAGWRVIPTGIRHGTVTVRVPNDDGTCLPVECTTCRTDGGYTDGRHPDEVIFTGRIEDDLSRRDFTVNALAMTAVPDEEGHAGDLFDVIDLFQGIEDLDRRIIRCVGDPHARLTEDALRILRAVRFAVQLGFDIHPATALAMKDCAAGLTQVSRERVRDEWEKILLSPDPRRGYRYLVDLGLAPYVLPRGISPDGTGDLAALPMDPATRMACLMRGMPPEAARENLHSLRLSNETFQRAAILQAGTIPREITPIAARRLRQEYRALARPLLLIEQARGRDTAALLALVEASEIAGDPVAVADLALNGRDLIRLGVPPGPAVGETLAALLACVLADPAENTRAALTARVQTWVDRGDRGHRSSRGR